MRVAAGRRLYDGGNHGSGPRYREHESGLDIVVKNSGAAWGGPFDEFPESSWGKVIDLNLKSLFFLTQALKQDLSAGPGQHPAKVINLVSIDGISVNPGETYSE